MCELAVSTDMGCKCFTAIMLSGVNHFCYQACEAGKGIIGHRGIRFSVCLLSVCLSVIKLLPAYGTDLYQNAYSGSLGHCEGQSRFDIDCSKIPLPPRPPPKKKDPPKWKFLIFLRYWLEILYITSWPLPHHKSWLGSQLQGGQLRMRRSIFFSFACIDLKFCR